MRHGAHNSEIVAIRVRGVFWVFSRGCDTRLLATPSKHIIPQRCTCAKLCPGRPFANAIT
eukprot:4416952-Alexandrium_andersonii.AAC.1